MHLGRRLARWAVASNQQAVANARRASTACSRRRVEREEVAFFLAGLAHPPVTAATDGAGRETAAAPGSVGVDSLSG